MSGWSQFVLLIGHCNSLVFVLDVSRDSLRTENVDLELSCVAVCEAARSFCIVWLVTVSCIVFLQSIMVWDLQGYLLQVICGAVLFS